MMMNIWYCLSVIIGRIHEILMQFCACEPEVCTVIRLGFWPSSPDLPCVAYSMELLELFHYLNVECQTSMKGFIEALRWKNNLTETEVSSKV